MALTSKRNQYYIHANYTAVYYSLYCALETWLANIVFRKDTSRIFLASDGWAFRRRFELLDSQKNYSDINAADLNFPFANYWPQGDGWHVYGDSYNPAPQVLIGIDDQDITIPCVAVTHTMPVTFYFNREDDARLAYDILFYNSYIEKYLYTTVAYKGHVLDIPLYTKINDLRFNPQYKESDWLQQNRIFVISASFILRSYMLKPPVQPSYTITGNEDIEKAVDADGTADYSLTEEVILDLYNHRSLFETLLDAGDPSKKYYPGRVTVSGIIPEDITGPSLSYSGIADTTATVSWQNKEGDPDPQSIEIYLSTQTNPIATLTDMSVSSYTLTDLPPGSVIQGYLVFYYPDGVTKKRMLALHTQESSVLVAKRSLKGKTF